MHQACVHTGEEVYHYHYSVTSHILLYIVQYAHDFVHTGEEVYHYHYYITSHILLYIAQYAHDFWNDPCKCNDYTM